MGFKFTLLCDLLSNLDDNKTAKACTAARNENPDIRTVAQWFSRHERTIHDVGTDRAALLSCMFPEKRTDRVYWLQAMQLSRIIGRCLGLGSSRLSELNRWQTPGGFDLGGCVEIVMRQAETYIPAGQELSVEEIDRAMAMIASRCRFSGPNVRRNRTAVDVDETLSKLYRRSSSRDAKWLTRMILKSYSPIVFPENYTLKRFHFLLPQLLQLQDSFDGVLEMLASDPISHFPPNPDPQAARSLGIIALQHMRPRPGIKVGRPDYCKARSIKHCHQMANGRRMSIERKYDGEYCQIHVDLSNKYTPVQIFSKSGKDSTADKDKIIPVIEESLGIGLPDCKFTQRCIVEGELLVWNDQNCELMDFNKIRRFIPRSGTMLGVDNDSPPQPYEHLMIMFFDILLLDNDVCLAKPHRERRLLLQKVVKTILGRADLAHQEVIDFKRVDSYHRLEKTFEKAIAQRWEGYVLKASDEPYFPIYSTGVDNMFGRWIKLKKDYIPGLGDTLDLALIGGSYNARDAPDLRQIKKLKWTHFFVGCLLNKERVKQGDSSPHFQVVDVINRHCMSIQNMQTLNQMGEFYASEPESFEGFQVEYGHSNLPVATTFFKQPFIVEMLGSGFEKPSGARYFTLRFPRILKIHSDRTLEECTSFQELLLSAEDARAVPVDELEEREKWSKRLKVASGLNQYIVRSRSPEATCSDTDEETNSSSSQVPPATTTSGENFMDVCPLMEGLRENSIREETYDRSSNNHPMSPLVYIDETKLHTGHGDAVLETRIIVNENSSSREHNSQKDGKITTQQSSSFLQITSFISVHEEHSQDSRQLRERLSGKVSVPTSSKQKRKFSPQSPLTTIPIWTPETSLGSFTLPQIDEHPSNDRQSCDLDEFIRCLCSDESASSLEKSNPYAASQGTRFGIILFDPKTSRLGEEMHRLATALSSFVHTATTLVPSMGNIFLLGSSMLERDLRPGDIRFCLRDTWKTIGRDHLYGCLSWNLSKRSDGISIAREKLCSGLATPWIEMTFDETAIAVLGEYSSIEPLAHVLYN
ncbi:Nucleic acid-binding OB-fold [Penicillium cf. griseofulvum]|uniref:Nucleic acid-binding OB-fold n=1 Tax=Penicillium cf. griseofulvum TaxID=2972120 RepID=A0A9W9LXJ9_9EURO|nr:Nucleic acid-binding OB-fold [Penicillium cf. griseofulvum]KAJ5443000.1 Nucleic acid-binding OB-fold [Penicillium cf. griseofulvum]KAJ5451656.1 Nucleic acid-binding OB-fold [Penicillium cf. griseofulvum]